MRGIARNDIFNIYLGKRLILSLLKNLSLKLRSGWFDKHDTFPTLLNNVLQYTF